MTPQKDCILVVDDEAGVRRLLNNLLSQSGYEVIEAVSGEAALKVVQEASVDLVITDLQMKEIDGLSLGDELLKQDADRPVLMMTAYGDLETARKAVSIGFYEYFLKPFEISDVLASVERALERRRILQENKDYQRDLERKVLMRTEELAQKVVELEARDTLLKHLLSIEAPDVSLKLAIKLACKLCDSDIGLLYMKSQKGELEYRVGVDCADARVTDETFAALGNDPEILDIIVQACENRTRTRLVSPPGMRQALGIHSVAFLPVERMGDVIAGLEVGRRSSDALLGETDLDRLSGFLSYVGMAVVDCVIQAELPRWQGEVESVLKLSNLWDENDST